jgi:hypothetical protein
LAAAIAAGVAGFKANRTSWKSIHHLFFECYYANKIFRPATYLVQGIRPLINFEVLIE